MLYYFQKKIPLKDLANICNFSSRAAQSYIYEGRNPRRDILKAIVEFLDFSEEYLLYKKEIEYSFGKKLSDNYNENYNNNIHKIRKMTYSKKSK